MANLVEKKITIIETTRDLVLEHGIDNVSMSKISNHSNLPMGTIYHIFDNKDELICETYKYCRNNIYNNVESDEQFSIQVFKNKIKQYIDNSCQNQSDFLFMNTYYTHPIIEQMHKYNIDFYIGNMRISDLIKQGVFVALDVTLITTSLLGCICTPLQYYFKKNIEVEEAMKSDIVQSVVRLLVKKTPSKE